MKLKINFWLVIVVITGTFVLTGVLAAFSSPDSLMGSLATTIKNKLPNGIWSNNNSTNNDSSIVVDVPEKTIADEKPDLIPSSSPQIKLPALVPQPALPADQASWQQEPSDNIPPPSSSPTPLDQTPWGQGPSQ